MHLCFLTEAEVTRLDTEREWNMLAAIAMEYAVCIWGFLFKISINRTISQNTHYIDFIYIVMWLCSSS